MGKNQKDKLAVIIITSILLVLVNLFNLNNAPSLIFYLIIYFFIAWKVLLRSVNNILNGQIFDENFLMSIATIGALFLGEYNEAIFVMLFYQIGSLFESYAVGKSRNSVTNLMDIKTDYANIQNGSEIDKVNPEDVHIGDTIIIKPGEKVPLDGVVLSGTSTINTSALTGESLPVDVYEGQDILSGSINSNGILYVKVTKEYIDSTAFKILELIETSASKKAKAEKFITKFAKVYTPIVVICAVILAVIPPLLFHQSWSLYIERALLFLVVSCPCALVISVPMSFFGGIGSASKQGILIKGSTYIEALSKVKTVVFDKTGTLTKGNFKVTAIHPDKVSKEELLELGAMAEAYSEHPVSISLKQEYGDKIDLSRISSYKELPGLGVTAIIDNKNVYVGNNKLMDIAGCSWHDCSHVGTIIHICVEKEYEGHIVISDEIKSNSKKAIDMLKDNEISDIVMLTGDKNSVAKNVANNLNINKVYSELLPEQKVQILEEILSNKNDNSFTAFVGDGINDAPVLTRADVGIAMGGLGSDAAIEAADVVLMDDNTEKIATAINISKKAIAIVKQNIVFALTVKLIVLILGAFGIATMWLAVFADVGVSVIAICNSMRTINYKQI